LNRVVGKRPIGKKIFFQGGTAYNDAVAAAFSQILNQKITVPPHNGVIGAVGSALLVRDLVLETGIKTSFKGFDLSKVSYSMREFACNGCTNSCDIQEFNVDNTKTYWGDKCSEKFRSKTKAVEGAVIGNLFKKRDEILKGVINEYPKTENSLNKTLIGIPESMYYWDQAPFWHALLSTLGFTVVTSGETNKKVIKSGLESTVSEPCYPIKVAHGHVQELIDRGVDYIWLPNILSSHSMDGDPKSKIYYVCPWGMTLPFVVRSSNLFADYKDKFLTPTMPYHYGEKAVFNDLLPFAKKFNISKRDLKGALKNAYKAEKSFNLELAKTGEKVLKKVLSENLPAVVILGRPYNTIDKSLNLNLAHKLEKNYGINVIPMDFIPTEGHAETLADNMFWNYGRRILAATKFVNNHDNLDIIYITNFKCGPDSYIKHYAHRGSRKPFLILQFDEHSNDAGFVTRIEAYLDSKGLLKKGISKQSDIKKVEESEKDLTAVNKKREIISEAIEDNE